MFNYCNAFTCLASVLILLTGCTQTESSPPTPTRITSISASPTATQNPPTATAVPPTNTPLPTPTTPPTPTVPIRVKNLIERSDLRPGKGPVYSQDWSPDGNWLVTTDFDQVRVWDTSSFQEVGVLEGHTRAIWGLAWAPDALILASASQDGTVRLWNVETYTQIALLETGGAFCVDWSPDGKRLAIGTSIGEVQVWDTEAQQLLHTWKSEAFTPIISIAWSPDGKTIASGDWAGPIYLWDVETGKLRQSITDYTDLRSDVNGLAWSPDGNVLASAHQDGRVRLWNADTTELIQTIIAHTGWVRGVAWSPDGHLLASTGQDKHIYLWDVATGQKYAEQHHNRLPVWSVSWSPDGKFVASGAGEYEQPHVGATIIWQVP